MRRRCESFRCRAQAVKTFVEQAFLLDGQHIYVNRFY
jgi:hypothetical protein